jgi:hypothetical protein
VDGDWAITERGVMSLRDATEFFAGTAPPGEAQHAAPPAGANTETTERLLEIRREASKVLDHVRKTVRSVGLDGGMSPLDRRASMRDSCDRIGRLIKEIKVSKSIPDVDLYFVEVYLSRMRAALCPAAALSSMTLAVLADALSLAAAAESLTVPSAGFHSASDAERILDTLYRCTGGLAARLRECLRARQRSVASLDDGHRPEFQFSDEIEIFMLRLVEEAWNAVASVQWSFSLPVSYAISRGNWEFASIAVHAAHAVLTSLSVEVSRIRLRTTITQQDVERVEDLISGQLASVTRDLGTAALDMAALARHEAAAAEKAKAASEAATPAERAGAVAVAAEEGAEGAGGAADDRSPQSGGFLIHCAVPSLLWPVLSVPMEDLHGSEVALETLTVQLRDGRTMRVDPGRGCLSIVAPEAPETVAAALAAMPPPTFQARALAEARSVASESLRRSLVRRLTRSFTEIVLGVAGKALGKRRAEVASLRRFLEGTTGRAILQSLASLAIEGMPLGERLSELQREMAHELRVEALAGLGDAVLAEFSEGVAAALRGVASGEWAEVDADSESDAQDGHGAGERTAGGDAPGTGAAPEPAAEVEQDAEIPAGGGQEEARA